MDKYEYRVLDIGFTGTMVPIEVTLNNMAEAGWRLVAVAQRVGNGSHTIRHYFERKRDRTTFV